MSPSPKVDYVSADAPRLYEKATGRKSTMQLLWGDRVRVVRKSGSRVEVRARGRTGWVEEKALGGKALLELYVIDVGQGDGILIKTPNGRHLMIDGGLPRRKQNTGKSAADFVDWKFCRDYGTDEIVLDALIASHCDEDHYGGLTDLLEVDESNELNCETIAVEQIYHAGVGWWVEGKGKSLGPVKEKAGEKFFTRLVGNRKAVEKAVKEKAEPRLHGAWARFMQAAVGARTSDGNPTPIQRLSSADGYVPEFGPGKKGEPAIKVLAPVDFTVNRKPAVRHFAGGDSINTNGNSLVLGLTFGPCRILLTGDLNRESQKSLLADYRGRRDEFLCDVGKACHHGSHDVSLDFLKAMSPAITIFSSGDNEDYDHPRPSIIGASAVSGYLEENDTGLASPLIYSTELVRSIKIAPGNKEEGTPSVVTGIVYGLVNVRTDGERILCATRDEKNAEWHVAVTQSRF